MTFAIGYLVLTYVIVILAGSFMGYLGGKYDLVGLRLVEIKMYFSIMVIILVSVMPGWWGVGWYPILTHHHGIVF